jgi:hypothetical protein
MAWTVAVAAVAIVAGVAASSIALIGLGLESVIELMAAAIVIWQLGGGATRERRAMRLIGATFLAGAIYLSVEASGNSPEATIPGPRRSAWPWLRPHC